MVPLATGTGCFVYYYYMMNISHLVQKCTSVKLRRSQSAHSPTSGGRGRTSSGRNFRPDVPVRALTDGGLPDRTSRPIRFRSDTSGVRSFPNHVANAEIRRIMTAPVVNDRINSRISEIGHLHMNYKLLFKLKLEIMTPKVLEDM